MLLLEDDPQSSETVALALESNRLEVVPVLNGEQALAAAGRARFDALLVDLQLPDLPGLDVVRTLHAQNIVIPFIVISGYASPRAVVEAMKLGALTVLEKPFAVEDLHEALNAVLWPAPDDAFRPPEPTTGSKERRVPADARMLESEPRSAVERWARFVLKAVSAEWDPKTLDQWARSAGVSRSVLCESCRILHISPHDARDFARVLRALCRSGDKWQPEIDIDVADARTLKRLESRAGLSGQHEVGAPALDQFLKHQHLIAGDHPALLVLRRMLDLDE